MSLLKMFTGYEKLAPFAKKNRDEVLRMSPVLPNNKTVRVFEDFNISSIFCPTLYFHQFITLKSPFFATHFDIIHHV